MQEYVYVQVRMYEHFMIYSQVTNVAHLLPIE